MDVVECLVEFSSTHRNSITEICCYFYFNTFVFKIYILYYERFISFHFIILKIKFKITFERASKWFVNKINLPWILTLFNRIEFIAIHWIRYSTLVIKLDVENCDSDAERKRILWNNLLLKLIETWNTVTSVLDVSIFFFYILFQHICNINRLTLPDKHTR